MIESECSFQEVPLSCEYHDIGNRLLQLTVRSQSIVSAYVIIDYSFPPDIFLSILWAAKTFSIPQATEIVHTQKNLSVLPLIELPLIFNRFVA